MRKAICLLAVIGALSPPGADAQVMIDMTRVTCADYLAMPPRNSHVFSAWMSGWFNQKKGYVWVDLGEFDRNIAAVQSYCASHPTEPVMSVVPRVAQK